MKVGAENARPSFASSRLPVQFLSFALAIAACGAPEHPAPAPPKETLVSDAPPATPSPPPQTYVLADIESLPPAKVVTIGDGALGVVIDGARTLLSPGGVSVARELTNPPLTGVLRIPAWLGGGYLFQTSSSLYTSEAFDGPLKPLVGFPVNIQPPAFGPKGLFVRGVSGERWAIELPSGARAAPAPAGLVEIVAVADGRVAVITEAGGALASVDRGAHWSDVAVGFHQPAASIVAIEGEAVLRPRQRSRDAPRDERQAHRAAQGAGLTEDAASSARSSLAWERAASPRRPSSRHSHRRPNRARRFGR